MQRRNTFPKIRLSYGVSVYSESHDTYREMTEPPFPVASLTHIPRTIPYNIRIVTLVLESGAIQLRQYNPRECLKGDQLYRGLSRVIQRCSLSLVHSLTHKTTGATLHASTPSHSPHTPFRVCCTDSLVSARTSHLQDRLCWH